ncbi:MAG: hypothetical protein H6Q73_16 [Firmicutes bacterium]|nr:hypothetical protein [Bacillota bacterium]
MLQAKNNSQHLFTRTIYDIFFILRKKVLIIAKQSEFTDEKTTVSARVSAAAVNILKQAEVPISEVIEAGILYFLSLDDIDKVAYLLKNNSDVADSSDFKIPKTPWPDCIRTALDLDRSASVKDEVRGFKTAAKWSIDKGAARLNQLSLRKLSTTEVIKKADLLSQNGQLQEALTYYDYALSVLKNTDDFREIARISMALGAAYCHIGNFSLALTAYASAEAYFSHDKNYPSDAAELALARGVCYQQWGKHKEAFEHFESARKLFLMLGNMEGLHQTFTRMGLSIDYCEPEHAASLYDEIINYFSKRKEHCKKKIPKL